MSHHLSTLETGKTRAIRGNRIGEREQEEIMISQIRTPAGEPFMCILWVSIRIPSIMDTIVIHEESKIRDGTISAVTLCDIDISKRRENISLHPLDEFVRTP